MEKHLHIIALDIPYPVNYGGVYDLFYKLPALQQQDVKIHLHCFYKNNRSPQPELNKYCEEVFYYPRNVARKAIASNLPYIVSSRINEELHQRLLKDEYPVLMEGVHCTYITMDTRFSNRKKFVRIHNVENEYYKQLSRFSHTIKNKLHYWLEAKKLLKYERLLAKSATAYWVVSQADTDYYRQQLNCKTIDYLPLYIPDWKADIPEGLGTYCLYHGNLEVEENEYAVKWLLKNVFNDLEIPFVVAGKNPSKKISALIDKNKSTCLVANPDETQMQDIISKAHIHVLPSFNNTGIKIKLLNALFNGRYCVVNNQMIAGTTIDKLCHVINTAEEFKERLSMLYHQRFTIAEKQFRKQNLCSIFSNEENAKQMVKWIWETYV
jgi:glycosyltransferase involved in cell wall biosynthesis